MEDGLKVTKSFSIKIFVGFDEGKVYGDSQVLDDAVVMDTAEVYQNAKIYNKAIVRGMLIYSSEDVLFISYNFSKRGLTFLKHEKMKYV